MIPMVALAAVNVVVILAFEVYVVCRAARNTPSRRHLFLGQGRKKRREDRVARRGDRINRSGLQLETKTFFLDKPNWFKVSHILSLQSFFYLLCNASPITLLLKLEPTPKNIQEKSIC